MALADFEKNPNILPMYTTAILATRYGKGGGRSLREANERVQVKFDTDPITKMPYLHWFVFYCDVVMGP